MSHACRQARRVARLKAEGRCIRCAEKIPEDQTWRGKPYVNCTECRNHEAVRACNRRNPLERKEDQSSLEATRDRTPGCIRCGLRGDHTCLVGSALNRRAWL